MDAAYRREQFRNQQFPAFRGSNGHTRVTHKSWGQRFCGSLCGVLVGLALLAGGVALLAWNEARVVRTARSLSESLDIVVDAPVDKILLHNEAKLVHVSGHVDELPILEDSEFGVAERCMKLVRMVEMYQYTEHKTTSTRKDGRGGEIRETSYHYTSEWSSRPIPSSRFDDPSFSNPTHWPLQSSTEAARTVRMGAWQLDKHVLDHVGVTRTVDLARQDIPLLKPGYLLNDGKVDGKQHRVNRQLQPHARPAELSSNRIYFGNAYSPVVGDIRVSWQAVTADRVSVVGQQRGNSFGPFPTRAGDDILLARPELLSAKTMIEIAQSENATLAWILRGVGCILIFVAFSLMMQPLVVAPEIIPCCGGFISSIIGFGACVVSTALTICVSMVTIAVAWLAQRPLLAGLLLLVALLPLFGLGCGGAKSKRGQGKMTDGKVRQD